ncbi:IclR family transcriptional regulator [Oryzomonas sagensis]|uniref:IclR family transcriptional regulator n=1 Tax=Oryzomonas sagensis TaxID=2603857 RepID=A0ABQ6TKV8_9BACT|nr:IclR family transcriptional regulator [Oryzomonas sagensis]KAB0668839.1 IclR family transcriptional regulator [Oryzomonas sagensis]
MNLDKQRYCIQSVTNALDLLEQFQSGGGELSFNHLVDSMHLSEDKVLRLLTTLEKRNYIEKDMTTGRCRLGLQALRLGQSAIRHMGLLRHARPVLESQVHQHNETTYIAVLRDSFSICLDAVESSQPVRVVPRLGACLPTYCTAGGKAHLAFMKKKELLRHLPVGKLQRYTSNTITDRDHLLRHLQEVAEQGFAIDNEELYVGVMCISAPLRDSIGSIVGTLNISGPVSRFTKHIIDEKLAPLVKCGAAEISGRLRSC